ncbi:hypothetical protein ACPC54_26895 [Kitasatospora sp. NPDC094028]
MHHRAAVQARRRPRGRLRDGRSAHPGHAGQQVDPAHQPGAFVEGGPHVARPGVGTPQHPLDGTVALGQGGVAKAPHGGLDRLRAQVHVLQHQQLGTLQDGGGRAGAAVLAVGACGQPGRRGEIGQRPAFVVEVRLAAGDVRECAHRVRRRGRGLGELAVRKAVLGPDVRGGGQAGTVRGPRLLVVLLRRSAGRSGIRRVFVGQPCGETELPIVHPGVGLDVGFGYEQQRLVEDASCLPVVRHGRVRTQDAAGHPAVEQLPQHRSRGAVPGGCDEGGQLGVTAVDRRGELLGVDRTVPVVERGEVEGEERALVADLPRPVIGHPVDRGRRVQGRLRVLQVVALAERAVHVRQRQVVGGPQRRPRVGVQVVGHGALLDVGGGVAQFVPCCPQVLDLAGEDAQFHVEQAQRRLEPLGGAVVGGRGQPALLGGDDRQAVVQLVHAAERQRGLDQGVRQVRDRVGAVGMVGRRPPVGAGERDGLVQGPQFARGEEGRDEVPEAPEVGQGGGAGRFLPSFQELPAGPERVLDEVRPGQPRGPARKPLADLQRAQPVGLQAAAVRDVGQEGFEYLQARDALR